MTSCLLSFIPGDNGRKTDLVHAREESECGEDERGPDELVLVEEGKELEWLETVSCIVLLRSPIPERLRTFSLDFSLISVWDAAGDAV